MPTYVLALAVATILWLAYRFYGGLLARLFRLDPRVPTPAVAYQDGRDFVPIDARFLIGQHFSAIAAAGPIVGPILAGLMFGWLPALLWILVGAIFIGGVHDLSALVASIRHRARSIAEVVRENMTRRSYTLFLTFIWFALVYILVAFTDITAGSFVGRYELENGQTVLGGGIATASLLYLALPIAMALLMRYARLKLWAATAIFAPLIVGAIVLGQWLPLDPGAPFGWSEARTKDAWEVFVLLFCFAAAMAPMWILLQPRGYLGGIFLYGFILVGGLGLLFGGLRVEYPAFKGLVSASGDSMAPFLFITVACGAISGFHALIASGTTSKQLRSEGDARLLGYGTMLMEAMVAFIALGCLMILASQSPLLSNPKPNFIFAFGIAGFLERVGIPLAIAVSIMLMAFTTFVYDTLDVCARLGRYIVQELTGWKTRTGAMVATGLTVGLPILFLLAPQRGDQPAWQLYWRLFGASNQLLAALTLLGVTVWLWRSRRARWAWFVTGLPCAFMYVMSVWALAAIIRQEFARGATSPVPWVGVVLVGLALLMLVEAVRAIRGPAAPQELLPETSPA